MNSQQQTAGRCANRPHPIACSATSCHNPRCISLHCGTGCAGMSRTQEGMYALGDAQTSFLRRAPAPLGLHPDVVSSSWSSAYAALCASGPFPGSREQVLLQYILLHGLNDTDEVCDELGRLLQGLHRTPPSGGCTSSLRVAGVQRRLRPRCWGFGSCEPEVRAVSCEL